MGNGNVKGSNLLAHRGQKKKDCSEIENLWYVVFQLFLHIYRQIEIVE